MGAPGCGSQPFRDGAEEGFGSAAPAGNASCPGRLGPVQSPDTTQHGRCEVPTLWRSGYLNRDRTTYSSRRSLPATAFTQAGCALTTDGKISVALVVADPES